MNFRQSDPGAIGYRLVAERFKTLAGFCTDMLALEAVHAWTENVTLQMCEMSHKDQALKLAGPIALLKLQSTRVSQFIMDEACQIFGGRAITRTGMGQVRKSGRRSHRICASAPAHT
eukprot:1239093-Pyramimonas_sp.AAC.3